MMNCSNSNWKQGEQHSISLRNPQKLTSRFLHHQWHIFYFYNAQKPLRMHEAPTEMLKQILVWDPECHSNHANASLTWCLSYGDFLRAPNFHAAFIKSMPQTGAWWYYGTTVHVQLLNNVKANRIVPLRWAGLEVTLPGFCRHSGQMINNLKNINWLLETSLISKGVEWTPQISSSEIPTNKWVCNDSETPEQS